MKKSTKTYLLGLLMGFLYCYFFTNSRYNTGQKANMFVRVKKDGEEKINYFDDENTARSVFNMLLEAGSYEAVTLGRTVGDHYEIISAFVEPLKVEEKEKETA